MRFERQLLETVPHHRADGGGHDAAAPEWFREPVAELGVETRNIVAGMQADAADRLAADIDAEHRAIRFFQALAHVRLGMRSV